MACTLTARIAVFFDDLETPLMEAIDKTFTSGRVGIGSFDDMNDFTAVKILGRKNEARKEGIDRTAVDCGNTRPSGRDGLRRHP